ncbi:putative lipase [Emiliania huxleyi virus 86]|uniref:Putative lipase n=2 Tax=Emiliania huxleyi virus 86 TaxID=181082 RepID=Q4A3C9_EHV8U|nr:putative lipase [Emiliania huxleyi virus 86]AEO97839.1 hypothetical protein ENVG_00142 [Emiliania huxleyi virus 84]AEP14965.1 hypothetical protein EOVG_00028 [Emiliania huxleyi virus 88]AHA54587.1 putative lipase [Emiliania huxleyi virus 145]AHA55628.1 putative lipase [Emiliania huxleyi virus 164]UKZ11043.1 hypothetical protein EhVM1_000028 [Emiliania huxleyi virus M1]
MFFIITAITALTALTPCNSARNNKLLINKCVKLSDAIYVKGHRDLKNRLGESGLNDIEIVENKQNNRALVYMDNKNTIVTFRGTVYPQNVVQDLNTRLMHADQYGHNGKVHTGFHEIWKTLEPEITKLCGDKHITFTGHSMAGSVAQIASCYTPSSDVITFGSSRTGNVEFAETVNDGNDFIYMFRNKGDYVTSLPLNTMGYRDTTPYIIELDENGNWRDVRLNPIPYIDDANALNAVTRGKISVSDVIKKHQMSEYAKRMLL